MTPPLGPPSGPPPSISTITKPLFKPATPRTALADEVAPPPPPAVPVTETKRPVNPPSNPPIPNNLSPYVPAGTGTVGIGSQPQTTVAPNNVSMPLPYSASPAPSVASPYAAVPRSAPAPAPVNSPLPAPYTAPPVDNSYETDAPPSYPPPTFSNPPEPSYNNPNYGAPSNNYTDNSGTVNYEALSRGFMTDSQYDAPAPANTQPDADQPTADVASLMELGFERARCEIALATAEGDVSSAAQLLFGETLANTTDQTTTEERETKRVDDSPPASVSAAAAADQFVPFSIDEQDVRMNGWLGRKSKVLKMVRKRFFVLKGLTLSTYLKKPESLSELKDDDAKDRIKITIDSRVKEADKKPNSFILTVDEDGKAKKPTEVFFEAEDNSTKDRWMQALRKCIDDIQRLEDEKEGREIQDKVKQLTALGYSPAAAEAALGAAAGDIGSAVDLLLSEGGGGGAAGLGGGGASWGGGNAFEDTTSAADQYTGDKTCRVQIPRGAKPGQSVEVTADNGRRYRITIPKGKKGGDYVNMAY